MKKCPFCAEEIQDEAIKCRFCNEILIGNPNVPQQKVPWYFNGVALWVSFIFFVPISVFWCVPLIWLHPKRSKNNKIAISLIMIVISLIAFQIIQVSVQRLSQYYGTMMKSQGFGL